MSPHCHGRKHVQIENTPVNLRSIFINLATHALQYSQHKQIQKSDSSGTKCFRGTKKTDAPWLGRTTVAISVGGVINKELISGSIPLLLIMLNVQNNWLNNMKLFLLYVIVTLVKACWAANSTFHSIVLLNSSNRPANNIQRAIETYAGMPCNVIIERQRQGCADYD